MANGSSVSDRAALIVAICVSAVWAAAMIVSFVNQKFSPPEGVNIAFGAVTGWLFNRQIRKDASE